MQYKAGDVLCVRFPYEDSYEEKIRPALFWKYAADGSLLILSKITSKHRSENKYEVRIEPTEINGLKETSWVRIDKTVKIAENKVLFVYGCITPIQFAVVKEKLDEYLNEIMRK